MAGKEIVGRDKTCSLLQNSSTTWQHEWFGLRCKFIRSTHVLLPRNVVVFLV